MIALRLEQLQAAGAVERVGYLADDEAEASGPVDAVRGLITGTTGQ